MSTRPTEAELIERAARVLAKVDARYGYVYQQPCAALSTFDESTQLLTLRNAGGDLGTFRYYPKSNRLVKVEVQS